MLSLIALVLAAQVLNPAAEPAPPVEAPPSAPVDPAATPPLPPPAAPPAHAVPPAPAPPPDTEVEAETTVAPADSKPADKDRMQGTSTNDPFGESAAGPVGSLTFRTLTQIRYGQTWIKDDEPTDFDGKIAYEASKVTAQANDGWGLNRAFLRVTGQPTKHVGAKLLVDFAEFLHKSPKRAIKLAYGEFDPWSRLQITAGLFKRTFSLLELLPIADFELADVGPTDDLIKDLGFGGRDIGAMVRISPLPKKKMMHVFVGTYAGDNEEGYDARPWKVVTGRVELRLIKALRLGANAAWRPLSNVARFDHTGSSSRAFPPYEGFMFGSEYVELGKGKAWGGDASLAIDRFALRAEFLTGTRTDLIYRGDARTFLSGWGIASFRIPVDTWSLLPTVRVEWLDTDRQHDTGGRLYLTGALNFDFTANLRLVVDLSYVHAQYGSQSLHDIPWYPGNPFKLGPIRPNEADRYGLIVQMQLKL
jgi:hypothetical protein